MNKMRLTHQTNIMSGREVHWDELLTKARVGKMHPTTVVRSFVREGLNVKWHPPRTQVPRDPEHVAERLEIADKWRKRPVQYWTDRVDLFMDNTTWSVPATQRAKTHLKKLKVRGHLRTRAEGLLPCMTKPDRKKHNMNTGDKLKIVAGLINCRVAVWHYVSGTWNGTTAADVYKGPINRALTRLRGPKRNYLVLEDNDPTGYKSNLAKAAKKTLGISAMHFPRYSPDLNPLDYFLWNEVERRMEKGEPKRLETTDAFKKRLRRTAMGIPQAVIKKGIADMKARLTNCHANGGTHVTWD